MQDQALYTGVKSAITEACTVVLRSPSCLNAGHSTPCFRPLQHSSCTAAAQKRSMAQHSKDSLLHALRPGVGSESLLSDSAQVRSTLQAKTYLQALSPEERRRLLRNTKTSGTECIISCCMYPSTADLVTLKDIDASTYRRRWKLPLPDEMSCSNFLLKTKIVSLRSRRCCHSKQVSHTVQALQQMRQVLCSKCWFNRDYAF